MIPPLRHLRAASPRLRMLPLCLLLALGVSAGLGSSLGGQASAAVLPAAAGVPAVAAHPAARLAARLAAHPAAHPAADRADHRAARFAAVPADITVDPQDDRDRFVGTGGVVVDQPSYGTDRTQTYVCPGCVWRTSSACDDTGEGDCLEVTRGCPTDTRKVRVWLTRPGEPERMVGWACIGRRGPVTADQVQVRVQDRFIRRVPPMRPACQPATAAVVGIPVVCRSGQPGALPPREFTLAHRRVLITVRPRWSWTFEPGRVLTTSNPGGVWPDASVTHTFLRAGTREVTVRVVWTGSYTIDGAGPYAVSGAVTQESGLPVRVVGGVTHLVN